MIQTFLYPLKLEEALVLAGQKLMPGMSYLKIGEHADVKNLNERQQKAIATLLVNRHCKSQKKLTSDKRHYRVGKRRNL